MHPSTVHGGVCCGWTADFEQLQFGNGLARLLTVAAGLRILNSYNDILGQPLLEHVAAGLRILNSYNGHELVPPGFRVAAGLRILNSYNEDQRGL